jgi:hypothetical protein
VEGDAQARALRYLEGVGPDAVTEAALRYDEYPPERALALARIEQARVDAELAGDAEAVDVLIALRDRERTA